MHRDEAVTLVKEAIRTEAIRQLLMDEKRKCPAGAPYYEEEISPYLMAEVVISKLEEAGCLPGGPL